MTDLILVEDIAKELKDYLKFHGIQALYGMDFADLDVYTHDLPIVADEDDYDQKNYILILIGKEVSDGACWDVEVHFSINIEDRDRDRSGNVNILYLMNEIYLFFIKKGIVGRHTKMEKEAYKELNEYARFPFYEGDLVTHWKLPLPVEEGLEDYL